MRSATHPTAARDALAGERLATLLREAGGRATPARVAILDLLLGVKHPLSHREIEDELAQRAATFDRVTLYRALEWMEEVGLAHKVAGVDRVWRFRAQTAAGHDHPHFQCRSCGSTLCLEKAEQPAAPGAPRGYKVESAQLTLRGLCPSCRG